MLLKTVVEIKRQKIIDIFIWKGYFSPICLLLKWVDHPLVASVIPSMDTLNLAKYVHYFILIICSIRWDTAGRYFPKVRHQLRATPDTHLLMDQAFVLVKWSFIRIVIKYLNMNIWNMSFQGSQSKTSETIKSYFLYTFAFLTVGKLKLNRIIRTLLNSWF